MLLLTFQYTTMVNFEIKKFQVCLWCCFEVFVYLFVDLGFVNRNISAFKQVILLFFLCRYCC